MCYDGHPCATLLQILLTSQVNPFPTPGNSAAAPFRRGAAWTASVSLRELGRLRHLVELVPTRPDELTVGTLAVPRVVQRMTGSCQPIHVICRQSWITTHISMSASPARAPLAARVAQGIVDGRQYGRVRCSRSLISHNEPSFPSSWRCLALKT